MESWRISSEMQNEEVCWLHRKGRNTLSFAKALEYAKAELAPREREKAAKWRILERADKSGIALKKKYHVYTKVTWTTMTCAAWCNPCFGA